MEQKDVVTAFVSQRDVFVSLPTSGSELCYVCLPDLPCYPLECAYIPYVLTQHKWEMVLV